MEGDRGVGALENRWWDGYRRWKKKGKKLDSQGGRNLQEKLRKKLQQMLHNILPIQKIEQRGENHYSIKKGRGKGKEPRSKMYGKCSQGSDPLFSSARICKLHYQYIIKQYKTMNLYLTREGSLFLARLHYCLNEFFAL